jgi:uncharacterized protein (DUF1800 family)
MHSLLAPLITAVLSLACAAAGAEPPAPEKQAVHVLNRLAFGPAPGDIQKVAAMGIPAWIEQQLAPDTLPLPPALAEKLASLATANRSAGASFAEFTELRKEVRDEEEGAKARRRAAMQLIEREAGEARLLRAIASPRQLEEVMVDFWFNHFNVFEGKGPDKALVASYERDAIRPYVFGSFRQMLGATAKHPAMLYYLDNHLSSAGQARRGLNENYARELMELHTMGVDGGYTQADVTALARMLTGWTYEPRALVRDNQTFRFDPRRHDQEIKTWLGITVQPGGQAEGEMALDILAMHPSTARHISTKLAQYFVSDAPPPKLVDRMAKSYLDSRGDIRTVLRTLFASEEFMAPENAAAKFKTPYQFVISAVRASGAIPANVAPLMGAMRQLGMPLYGCQTPDGYKNTQQAWLNPDALTKRITFASGLAAGRVDLAPGARAADAAALQATLGPGLSARTLDIAAANPAPLRAAMLLASPDFMQR